MRTIEDYCVSRLGALSAAFLLLLCSRPYAWTLAAYCPPAPATGQLTYKSIDGPISACTPGPQEAVGQAVFQCWQQLIIEINGCQASIRTTDDQLVGPGRMPCRMFAMSGNLTGEGIEAEVWADVDGPGLLSYYLNEPEAVAALRYENSLQLVKDIWAFLRRFTGDTRFDNTTWIDGGFSPASQLAAVHNSADISSLPANDLPLPREGSSSQFQQLQEHRHLQEISQLMGSLDAGEVAADDSDAAWRRLQHRRRPQQLEKAAAAAAGYAGEVAVGSEEEEEAGLAGDLSFYTRNRHGPMRVYRTSETRVVVKAPTGCKYRYTVNPDSRVFEHPDRPHPHIEWHTILITVASFSVVLSIVGLGACTYFSRKHAEYVAGYWEYQAVKDQLSTTIPQATYVRLFGEEPKSATTTAAAAAAAATARPGSSRAATTAAVTAAAAAPPSPSPPQLPSPAAQHGTESTDAK